MMSAWTTNRATNDQFRVNIQVDCGKQVSRLVPSESGKPMAIKENIQIGYDRNFDTLLFDSVECFSVRWKSTPLTSFIRRLHVAQSVFGFNARSGCQHLY
jgi:hypothetical protein